MEPLRQKVYCTTCKRRTNHGVVQKHEVSEFDEESGFGWAGTYLIIQCLGCDNIHFLSIYNDNSMINQEGDYFDDVSVYPPEPTLNDEYWNIQAKSFTSVPDFLSRLYGQVVDAYNSQSLLLSAIGLRAMVEAICIDLVVKAGFIYDKDGKQVLDKHGKQVRSESLQGRINGLVEGGFLVQKQASVLHQIRELGNYAAHEVKEPRRRTIQQGIEVIESIVHSIYELDTYKLVTKK